MSDIVERLRNRKAFGRNGGSWLMLTIDDADCQDGANEIERYHGLYELQKAETERLRAELSQATGNSETFEETRRQVVKAREKRLAELVEENAALRAQVEQANKRFADILDCVDSKQSGQLLRVEKIATRAMLECQGVALSSDDRK